MLIMKTAVVYYSLEGNTEFTANIIAETLDSDIIKLEPKKAYPTGKISKFVWGGKSAMMSETPGRRGPVQGWHCPHLSAGRLFR